MFNKILLIFILLIGFSSCLSDRDILSEQENTSFRIKVDSVIVNQVIVSISPSYNNSVCYVSLVKKNDMEQIGGWDKLIYTDLLDLKAKASVEEPTVVIEDMLVKGDTIKTFNHLSYDTEYIAYAFELKDELLLINNYKKILFNGGNNNSLKFMLDTIAIDVPFVKDEFITGTDAVIIRNQNKEFIKNNYDIHTQEENLSPRIHFHSVVH